MNRTLQCARIVFRQLRRNPRRTALTFLGLAVSFFLFTSLQSALATLDQRMNEAASETTLVLRPRNAGLLRPELPSSYAARLRDMTGIVAVSPVRFHLGLGRRDDLPALVLGIDAGSFFDIYRPAGLSDEELALLRSTRQGAVMGKLVLEANQWKIGERVSVRSPVAPPLVLQIVGDIDAGDRMERIILTDLDYLGTALGDAGRTSVLQARIERASDAPALAQQIDQRFANLPVPTETATEKAHMTVVLESFADAFHALQSIGYLTLLVTVLVVANSVAMNVRERTVEIGTLRALGFSRRWLAGMVLSESMLVSLAGGFTGSLAAFALFGSGVIPGPDGLSLPPVLEPLVLAYSALLALLVGLLAAIQPLVVAVRMPIASALGYAV